MQSGYKTITPIELANVISALEGGGITHDGLRVYLACLVMIAVREAAGRYRKKRREPSKTIARYQIKELKRITGLPEAKIRRSLKYLQHAGLLIFAESEIVITKTPLPGSEEMLNSLAGGRSPKRPIPVPRSFLRFLAQNRKPALTKTSIAYLVRGLSLSRTGEISGKGTAKVSWIAKTFGLSERAVSYARSELVKMGWIERDAGSYQRKLNRDGAYFSINLAWYFVLPRKKPEAVENVAALPVNGGKFAPIFAPPQPENCTIFAPPNKDKKTSYEIKNQKTSESKTVRSGFCLNGGGGKTGEVTPKAPEMPPPKLSAMRSEDFTSFARMEALFLQAVGRGWIEGTEAAALNFLSAAVRAREVGEDPPRLFVSLVRRRLWSHITQAQEDKARIALIRFREEDPGKFRISERVDVRRAA